MKKQKTIQRLLFKFKTMLVFNASNSEEHAYKYWKAWVISQLGILQCTVLSVLHILTLLTPEAMGWRLYYNHVRSERTGVEGKHNLVRMMQPLSALNWGIFFWMPYFTGGLYDLKSQPTKRDDISLKESLTWKQVKKTEPITTRGTKRVGHKTVIWFWRMGEV